MKKEVLLFLVSFLTLSMVDAASPVFVGSGTSKEGQSFLWQATEAQLLSTPSWDGDRAPLPLDYGKAINISREYLMSTHPKTTSLQLRSINLMRFNNPTLREKWVYICNFTGEESGVPVVSPEFSTYVLLDGTLVRPIIKNRPEPAVVQKPLPDPR